MKLKFNNKILEFNQESLSDVLKLNFNNEINEYNFTEVNDHTFILNSGSNKKTAYYFKDKNNIIVNIEGSSFKFDLVEDTEFNDFYLTEDKNSDIIKSPMPGSVIKLLVNVGDMVEEGSALIIIEAMKMETTLYSSINGKITEINTKNGEQISPDRELIKIEKITD